jgi:signal transduction histidine kinase
VVASERSERNTGLRRVGRRPAYAGELAAVALLYFCGAKFGFLFAFATKQVTAVWPPTGIALVALLLRGYRMAPGVLVGAFIVNAVSDEPIAAAAGIAVGNTLGPLLGAFLLERVVKLETALTRVRDILGLLLCAVVSMTVSATNGVAHLALAHIVSWRDYAKVWWVWWVGDVMGVLLVAPLLLTWLARPRLDWRGWRAVEVAALLATLLVTSQVIFASSHHHQMQYLVFPVIIWAALRFGQREIAAVALLLAGIASWGAMHQRGPFTSGTLDERLVLLEAFLAVATVTALVLGAVASERRQAEEGLRLAHDELEERVRERTDEIERLRAEWNSVIAHDLGQPIAGIMINAQLLAQQIAAASALHKPSLHILSCARRLNRLVRELVDYSQLQTRQIELSRDRVDLLQLLSMSIESVAHDAPDRRFDVRARGEVPPIRADADRLAQVLDNLLSNAVKYGQPASTIEVEVGAVDGMVTVAVTNQGMGIDAEELPQLFHRFARTDKARKSGVKGLGLGLYIVRELIEAHGGEVEASSTPGGTTTFVFTLPIG